MKLFVGIDPSQKHNGFAYRIDDGVNVIGSFHPIEEFSFFFSKMDQVLVDFPDIHLWACIECPTWGGYGTKEVRSAALMFERMLLRRFDKRNVYFVDPRNWQSLMLMGVPGETTKEKAIWRCQQSGLHPANDHEADAICLMQYAEMRSRGMVTTTDERGERERKQRARAAKKRRSM